MEETGCEIICGVPTTLAVKGQMMMIAVYEQEYWNNRQVLLIFDNQNLLTTEGDNDFCLYNPLLYMNKSIGTIDKYS